MVTYASATNCTNDATQYLAGRKMVDGSAIKVWAGTPHKPTPHQQGTQLNSFYGDGPEITRIEGIGNSGNALTLTQETIEKALLAPYYVPNPTYAKGAGPVKIKVIDPFKVPSADFELRLIDNSNSTVKSDTLTSDATIWVLTNLTTGKKDTGEAKINSNNEQIFADLGLSITLYQVVGPGHADDPSDDSNGFLSASIEYSDPTNPWLPGIPDELAALVPFNWIRAGNTGTPGFTNPYEHDFAEGGRAIDPRRQYNKVLGGTWAPYALAARAVSPQPTYGPAWAPSGNGGYSSDNKLADLKSVMVVITADKTKWSRCVVLESGENPALTIGNQVKMNRRKSPSVGKDGKPDGTGTGMSWFPGYAINKETGERLNIMFAEDSSLPLENGTDMIWNPTSNLVKNQISGIDYLLGGKHHIYVMGSKPFRTTATGPVLYNGPRYDECASYNALFDKIEAGVGAVLNKRYVFSQAMWVTMPLVSPKTFLGDHTTNGGIPCDVKINLNVKRPYATINQTATDTVANSGVPLYTFSTANISPSVGGKETAKSALDMVSLTPNPYYAYAGYEDPGNQLDSRVKIINLPTKCVVSIYTQGGFLVRRIKKDDDTKTYLDWDLKNDAGVPIASGVYLVHVYADGIGERVIKWFGVMRPVDFDTF